MIRLQETDDGWVIEVTGKQEVAVVSRGERPHHRIIEPIWEEAVAAERARCLAWLRSWWQSSTTTFEIEAAIRDGKEAPQ